MLSHGKAVCAAVSPMFLLSLAGCGGGGLRLNGEASKPARQILADAGAALSRARSLRIQGVVKLEGRPTAVTLSFERPGRVNMALRRGSETATARLVGHTSYMNANASLYEHQAGVPAAAASLVAGRWVKIPKAEDAGGLFKALDIEKWGHCVASETGTLRVGGTTTLDGRLAVIVVNEGDRPGATPAKIYIAASGAPYLLRMVATGKQRPGGGRSPGCDEDGEPTEPGDVIDFSNYNGPMHIGAPPGASTVAGLLRNVDPSQG